MMPLLLPPRRRYGAHAPGGDDGAERAPTQDAGHAPRTGRSDLQRGARFDTVRILVVDDDLLFSEMLPRLLRKSVLRPTLEVVGVASAEEADRRLAGQPFDVVLCDYDLRAARTGLDILAQAARLRSRPLCVLFSGHAPREIAGLDQGAADAFLDKPMTLREMVPLLAELLHERLGIELELVERA